ncbi:MAG: hypothetical protein ACRDD1_17455 [Planctomycetia bacterium]
MRAWATARFVLVKPTNSTTAAEPAKKATESDNAQCRGAPSRLNSVFRKF